ncbi:hypothetical protein FHS16_004659 [Paenibacillus endophyticus]|uniref:Uncharacterized protein n=1 Tax=Paenibacillus endophyticus TaxID=1294268 RepID=A0A7W5CBC1_9BACL|nr:hypothetical protein [Paenibacillus endophyticus]MBB3154577.1 hypothetical protein [Paenibacillus endophyticus]
MLGPIILVLFAIATGIVIWRHNGGVGRFRERGWSLFILVIGALYSLAILLNMPIPNPTDWISAVLAPIYKPILAWIEEGM